MKEFTMRVFTNMTFMLAEVCVANGKVYSATQSNPDGTNEIYFTNNVQPSAQYLTDEKLFETVMHICRNDPKLFKEMSMEIKDENYKALMEKAYDRVLKELQDNAI